MKFILGLAVRLPAWCFLILTVLVYVGGTMFLGTIQQSNQAFKQASADLPAERTDFTTKSPQPAGEVFLRTQIDPEIWNYFYYETDSAETLYELFHYLRPLDWDGTSTALSAVLIFETYDLDQVKAWLDASKVDKGDGTQIFEIRGYAESSDLLDLEAKEILRDHGTVATDDVVYIRAFLEGRDTYYEANIVTRGIEEQLIQFGIWVAMAVPILWLLIRPIFRIFFPIAGAKGSTSKIKTAATVTSSAAALVGFCDDDDDTEDDSSEFGIALAVGKIIFRIFGGGRKRDKAQEAALSEAYASDIRQTEVVPKRYINKIEDMPVYEIKREEFLPDDEVDEIYRKAAAAATRQ